MAIRGGKESVGELVDDHCWPARKEFMPETINGSSRYGMTKQIAGWNLEVDLLACVVGLRCRSTELF